MENKLNGLGDKGTNDFVIFPFIFKQPTFKIGATFQSKTVQSGATFSPL